MSAHETFDAVVIGAGPAGSSMAAGLAEAGWQVLVVERDAFPRHKVCGEFISPEAQTTLHALGLYQTVADLHPKALETVTLLSQHGSCLQRPLPGAAWGISRYALDATLATAAMARGAELWTETTARKWQRKGNHYVLELRRGQEAVHVEARTIILAYGRNHTPGLSPARRVNQRKRSTSRRYVGVKSHYAGVPFQPAVELFFFRGGYAGLSPIEEGKTNFCLMVSYQLFAEAGRSIAGLLEMVIANHAPLAQRLASAEPVAGTECTVAPVETARRAKPWDGAATVGDTTVMLPPLCGDGMAMALRSTELCLPLADAYLQGALTLPAWATIYRQQWQQEFSRRVWLGRWLQRLFRKPLIVDALLATGAQFPVWADYFVEATRGEVGDEAG
jgi:menaquinone-9 beta-reductase